MIHNARKHVDSVVAEGLPADRAYGRAGFCLGWAVENGLHNDEELAGSEWLDRFLDRELTAPALLAAFDGMIDEETLDGTGYAFAEEYVGWQAGQYFSELVRLFAVPTVWHIEDTWSNFDRVRELVDARYAEWAGLT